MTKIKEVIHISNLELLHSKLIEEFVDKGLLGRHMQKYVTTKMYPVIVGGTNIVRCANLNPKARVLIGKLYKNDIDIKFVLPRKVKSPEDKFFIHAHKMRMQFINDLLTDTNIDTHLANAIKSIKAINGIEVKLVINDKLLTSIHEHVRLGMVVSIRADYYINGVFVMKKGLVDTALYTTFHAKLQFDSCSFGKNVNCDMFFKKNGKQTIPYETDKGVLFGTCGWIYYDTVRMLVYSCDTYLQALQDHDIYNIHFYFVKHVKYVAKFAVLWTQVNQLKDGKKYNNIKNLYSMTRDILNKYDVMITDDIKQKDLDDRDKNALIGIMDLLRGETNIEELEKVIRASSL